MNEQLQQLIYLVSEQGKQLQNIQLVLMDLSNDLMTMREKLNKDNVVADETKNTINAMSVNSHSKRKICVECTSTYFMRYFSKLDIISTDDSGIVSKMLLWANEEQIEKIKANNIPFQYV